MSLEQTINYQLNKYPAIKKIIKRGYQLAMYAISPKIKSEGNITRLSPDDPTHEYFFGYYDKSPWDASGRYVLCMKAKDTWSDVSPQESAEIILIDTTDGSYRTLATTHSWNVQQGCMAQWIGPDYLTNVLYNDCRDGKYCSVILNLSSNTEIVIPAPVYSVAADGKIALTLDFSRLYNLRPGYGYYNVPEVTKGVACPDTTAIWTVDLVTGVVTPLLKYTDFATFKPRPEMQEADSVHKVNHIMLSPNGKRFMVLYRWFCGQRKYTRLITCNTDGTDMYVLSDDDMVSHCFWKGDESILAFENKKDGGPGYYLMRDKTQEYKHLWPSMSADGHPSYSPDGNLVVTDTYPDRARVASVKVMSGPNDFDIKTVTRVFAPFKYDNDTRCDLHPRWSRDGKKIAFDAVYEGRRGLYMVCVFSNSSNRTMVDNRRIKIAFIMTACKKSGPVQQMLNTIKYLDRSVFDAVLITLYEEPTDGTSQLKKYEQYDVRHFFCPLGKLDVVLGRTDRLRALISKEEVDVIYSLGVFPDYAVARMKTGKQVITLRNYVYEDYPAKYGLIQGTALAKLHLYAIRHAAKTVACSKSLSDMYRSKLGLDYEYICNGVDVDKYTYADRLYIQTIRQKLNLPLDKIVFVYSGQVIERKNHRFLLDVFTKVFDSTSDAYLLILGDGSALTELKARFGYIGNIDFRGSVTNVDEYLKASDVCISTSKSEGLPNSVLEAMATGLPVLLSDIQQHKEIFCENESMGLLYSRGDVASLERALNEMVSSDLSKQGGVAYQVAHKSFNAKETSLKYQEIFISIANGDYQHVK